MIIFPLWVRVLNVKTVGMNLNWQHCFNINFKHSEWWVNLIPSGERTSPILYSDRSSCWNRLSNVMNFLMDMTINSKSNNVLESIWNSFISNRPLVQARLFTRRDVRNNDCNLTSSFNSMESFIQPLKNTTGIISLTPEIKVKVIARLSVNGYYINFVKNCSILKLKFLSIITNLSINFLCFFI